MARRSSKCHDDTEPVLLALCVRVDYLHSGSLHVRFFECRTGSVLKMIQLRGSKQSTKYAG